MIIKTYNGKQIGIGLLDKLSDAIQEQFLQLCELPEILQLKLI